MDMNPYVGARAFLPHEKLYGREREVQELCDLLLSERIVLVHAPSGAGKTSLIQAGLRGPLSEHGFIVSPVLRVGAELPAGVSETANRYVLSTLMYLDGEDVTADETRMEHLQTLSLQDYVCDWENFDIPPLRPGADNTHSGASPTGEYIASVEQELSPEEEDHFIPPPRARLLVFDQFEEVLTQSGSDVDAKKEFFRQLGTLLRGSDSRSRADDHRNNDQRLRLVDDVWALFSIREEFVSALEPYLWSLPGGIRSRYRMDFLGIEAAAEAIEGPAASRNVTYQDDAVSHVIDDLRTIRTQLSDGSITAEKGPYVEPVHLQVVCERLWRKLPIGTKVIAKKSVKKLGGVDHALRNYYRARVKAVSKEDVELERRIRTWISEELILPQGVRNQVLRGTQTEAGLDEHVIAELDKVYLVRTEKRRGLVWYELAHDRLIDPVRDDNARWFAEHASALHRDAAFWEAAGRRRRYLLHGDALTAAVQAAPERKLTRLEKKYLRASTEYQRMIETKKLHARIRLLAAVLLAVVVTGGAGAGWIMERAIANRSTNQKDLYEVRSNSLVDRALQVLREPDSKQAKVLLQTQISAISALESVPRDTLSEGVRIVYYKRSNDSGALASAIESLGYAVTTQSSRLDSVPINVVRYGSSVPKPVVRNVAISLMAAGIPLKKLIPAPDSVEINQITIMGQNDLSNSPALQVNDVLALAPLQLDKP